MKIVLCLALVVGCAIAEYCDHDDDCTQTTCHSAFRVDCDHIDHKYIDVRECTCIPLDKHTCLNSTTMSGDQWCALNQHDSCHKDGKSWHCSPRDNQCRCYCDRRTHNCDDDDDK